MLNSNELIIFRLSNKFDSLVEGQKNVLQAVLNSNLFMKRSQILVHNNPKEETPCRCCLTKILKK